MGTFFRDVFQTRYREATASAILFAIVIGVVMNAAITYAGLKIGFTIGGSAIAAVLGFGVLRAAPFSRPTSRRPARRPSTFPTPASSSPFRSCSCSDCRWRPAAPTSG